ncbi:MAG: hypothetical protein U2P89_02015 [Proteiniphilum sp.]|uniref:hypothetical protein n=1 Tax=Proteiniphilum sp. TaxID=1926877 RepID=UPI002ABC6FB9|nr:hypothetical protein [Proteiniphilum sp.]MDY9917631.1 hypothetical protein [Proteiniphilum sp.]
MKKTNSLQALWMMCMVLVSGLLIPACDTGDELDTNQYSGGIELNVFGPSPVARGGELRFLGSGMNQVTGVLIPGSTEITDIKVISETEIRVTVPQTAEVGYVVLHTPKGDITTKTTLTYSEPISLKSISPLSLKPGEVLTITGEYLNLMHEVIFTDGVIVAEAAFIKHQRDEIQVVVPAEAQSGKVVISDAAELPNWIYSDEELSVVLPSVDAVADLTGKKPGDLIEIAGKDLDLVKALRMPNGDEVEFEVKSAAEGEAISFVLPENMSDGAVVMVPASGVEVTIANIGMALPTEVVATPAAGLRAGDEIILTGVNMELITDITFPGVGEAVEPTSQTATEVKVAMPALAISGNLLLNTGSGMSVEVPIETEKPEHTAYQSDAVSLGGDVVISGNHLDLVVKVAFTGGGEVEVSAESPTRLTVAMPTMNVETGVLTAYMANGESVEFPRLTINAPQFAYIPVLPGEDDELQKGGTVMTIGIANGDKLTGVQVDGANVQYIINQNRLYFEIPQLANANSKVTLVSSNGEVTYNIAFIPATDVEIVIFNTLTDLGSWSDPRVLIPASEFDRDIPSDAKMKIYFAQKDAWGQIQFNDGTWNNNGISFPEIGGAYLTTDNAGGKDVKEIELSLTPELVERFRTKGGIVIQGENWIISKVSITYKVALETTVWTGPVTLTWSDGGRVVVPASTFSSVRAGAKMRFYFDQIDQKWAQAQINDGTWGQLVFTEIGSATLVPTDVYGWTFESRVLEVTLTRAILDQIEDKKAVEGDYIGAGLIIQGSDLIFNKVTIE